MKMMLRLLISLAFPASGMADPQLSSWFTVHSGQDARVYRDDADLRAGESEMTWSNGHQTQAVPARDGVQEVLYSTNWIYIRSTGLASQIMGPWYDNPQHTRTFPNLPLEQHILMAFPRHPMVANRLQAEQLGEIGLTVDGVSIFDVTDSFSYSHRAGMDAGPRARIGRGDMIWDRDAMANEAQTFDPGMGHQEIRGRYHYHAEAIALRYELGDHVDFDATTKTYRESTGEPTRHSPIIGWLVDGYPVYGPYGFANPTNPASGLRRLISGYVPRNGEEGADNLLVTGRRALPAWQARESGRTVELAEDEMGPVVSPRYPLGHYVQDYAYRGDLGGIQGRDFDLDEHNGRWCVTPEFPHGTYAYFTSLDARGKPVYPYMMGKVFHGQPVGQTLRRIAEPVTTYFTSAPGTDTTAKTEGTAQAAATLTWNPASAGGYQP